MKTYIILLILLTLPSTVLSTPSDLSVTGDMGRGLSITIGGINFGSKASPEPLIWDDFETGTSGGPIGGTTAHINNLPGSPAWGGNGATFSATGLRSASTRAARSEFISSYGSGFKIPLSQQVVYFTYWYKINHLSAPSYTDNIKPFMWTGSRDGEAPIAYLGYGEQGVDGSGRNALQDIESLGNNTLWGSNITQLQEWVRLEFYIAQSDPNTFNGTYQFWLQRPGVSASLILNGDGDRKTRATAIGYDELNIMPYARLSGSQGAAQTESLTDDIYIDSTLARVELCDGSTWANKTFCEIQLPTTWSDTSITATVNPGAFTAAQTAYIYVVDANGDVNTNGYAVTIGSGDPVDPPTCETHPAECADQSECETASWYWYNAVCNAQPEATCSTDSNLCMTEGACNTAGWTWAAGQCWDYYEPPFSGGTGLTPFNSERRVRYSPSKLVKYKYIE